MYSFNYITNNIAYYPPSRATTVLSDSLKACLWAQRQKTPGTTFVDNLLIDTEVETTGELETLMLNRMKWRRVIQDPWAAPADPP